MKTKLRYFWVLIFLIGCGTDNNSNSFDAEKVQVADIDTSTDAGKRLFASYGILKDNCMNCHSGYHSDMLAFNTDNRWIIDGRVVPGSSVTSDLINQMKNDGGDMPIGSSQISADDFDTISNWIDNL
jgi:mono/diheme cytochrome c family protein